jgi:KDO2-lipid IV(A) lauroyltransferase
MKLATYEDFVDLGLSLLASGANSWWGRGEGLRRRIGDLSYLLRPARRRILLARLSAALGLNLPDDELRRMTRTLLRNTWLEREVYWLRLLASEPDALSRIGDLVTVDGLEHLRGALAAGRGAVVWECPLGNRSLGRLALSAEGFHVTVVHGPKHGGSSSCLGQRVIRRLHRAAAARLPVEVVDIDLNSAAYIELLMDRLCRNGVVCINGFGRLGRRPVALDFLGQKRYFATGPASLAITTGAALIPAFCHRDSSGRRHLTLERPCPVGGGESVGRLHERAVRYCGAALEAHVLRYPDQWMGWHEAQ